jgi:hypothetical protein
MKLYRLGRLTLSLTMSLASLGAGLAACSTEAWYEGVKVRARNECYQQPAGERQNCLDRVNKDSYDKYEKERASQKP